MPNLPKAGVQVEADHSTWDRDYKSILSDADKLDSLNPTVKIGVDDAAIKTAAGLAADLDTSVTTKVNVDDAEIKDAHDQLETIATIGAIDLAINIAGTAKGFFESLGRFSGIGGILELDSALASLEARTGKMIPDAERLIEDLYVNGWGESRTQIADVIAQASQLKLTGDDMATAVENALIIQAVYGEDTTETLRTMDTMVKNNLAPDFQTAADIIVAGFQTGGDRGQDLLDTLNEYGSTFGNLRISGEGALGIINSGLDAGVDNSDRIADAIRETGIRLGEIGTTPAITDAFNRLDELSDIDLAGMLDAFNAGEISGDQFFAGFFAALADAVEADPVEAQVLAAQLVGTISEDFGVESIAQLTPVWDDTMGALEGRAETAGTNISNTLAGSIDTFLRNVENAAVTVLESDAIDLDGKIETLKKQIQDAASTLASGGTIGEALEVGFHIEGVDTALANIQRVFGQFVIAILEIVATLQELMPGGSTGEETRGEIARLATQQLPFDIKVANPEELDAIFNQALNRGVTGPDALKGLETALDELVASGDFSKVIDIVGAIENAEGVTPETVALFKEKYVTPLGTAFDDAIASGDFDLAKKISEAQDDPTAYTDALKGKFGFDAAAFDQMAADFATGMETSIAKESWWDDLKPPAELDTALDTTKTNFGNLGTDAATAVGQAALASTLASDEMVAALAAMSDGVVTADEQIALGMTGNTITKSFQTVAQVSKETMAEVVANVRTVFPVVAQLDAALRAVAATAASVQQGVNTAISAVGAAGGGNTTTNIVVNNTNNVQGNAQAAANGYELGKAVRGMA